MIVKKQEILSGQALQHRLAKASAVHLHAAEKALQAAEKTLKKVTLSFRSEQRPTKMRVLSLITQVRELADVAKSHALHVKDKETQYTLLESIKKILEDSNQFTSISSSTPTTQVTHTAVLPSRSQYDDILEACKKAEIQRDEAARYYNEVVNSPASREQQCEAATVAAHAAGKLAEIGAQFVLVATAMGADPTIGFEAIQRGIRTATHAAYVVNKELSQPSYAALQYLEHAIGMVQRLLPNFILQYGEPKDPAHSNFLDGVLITRVSKNISQ